MTVLLELSPRSHFELILDPTIVSENQGRWIYITYVQSVHGTNKKTEAPRGGSHSHRASEFQGILNQPFHWSESLNWSHTTVERKLRVNERLLYARSFDIPSSH